MNRRQVFVIAMGGLLAACGRPGPMSLQPNSTLYVVRHSDRLKENLSEKGKQRSRDLVTALEGAPLDFIFSPSIQRNLDTAAPLSEARGLRVKWRAQERPTARLIRETEGKSAIWIGNKGNIRRIWEALELPGPAPLEYGDLHVIRSDENGNMTVERRRFGPE